MANETEHSFNHRLLEDFIFGGKPFIEIVAEYGKICIFIFETAGVIPLTVGLVSTRQISDFQKCVPSYLHTHCLTLQRVSKAAT